MTSLIHREPQNFFLFYSILSMQTLKFWQIFKVEAPVSGSDKCCNSADLFKKLLFLLVQRVESFNGSP